MPAGSNEQVYTVSELNRLARQLLEQDLPRMWVSGEISNLARPASGHLYFSLKDERAQIRCALFRGASRGGSFMPANGMQVLARGRVSLYEPRGDYQLIVDHLEPAGEGLLRRRLEELKQKLAAAGLFDAARKRPLPALPGAIGVITSPSGAAVRDILHILKRRFPAIPVIIYPVQVQGEQAKFDIVKAFETAARRAECEVLILARGGGSLEDLWAFNEEIVAQAIADSPIPVISGVGHEIDFTIADLVADVRAPTPSGAAELVVPDSRDWLRHLQALERRTVLAATRTLARHAHAPAAAGSASHPLPPRLPIAAGRATAGRIATSAVCRARQSPGAGRVADRKRRAPPATCLAADATATDRCTRHWRAATPGRGDPCERRGERQPARRAQRPTADGQSAVDTGTWLCAGTGCRWHCRAQHETGTARRPDHRPRGRRRDQGHRTVGAAVGAPSGAISGAISGGEDRG